ncbi:MAG: hypothetical protein V7K57_15420 [Nostoc sp.]
MLKYSDIGQYAWVNHLFLLSELRQVLQTPPRLQRTGFSAPLR